jgi:hypothetical protein
MHVAGGKNPVDVSHLVNFSYPVTLTSLLHARETASVCMKSKFLTVSQPNTPNEFAHLSTPMDVRKVTEAMCRAGCSEEMILYLQKADAVVERVWSGLEDSFCLPCDAAPF